MSDPLSEEMFSLCDSFYGPLVMQCGKDKRDDSREVPANDENKQDISCRSHWTVVRIVTRDVLEGILYKEKFCLQRMLSLTLLGYSRDRGLIAKEVEQ